MADDKELEKKNQEPEEAKVEEVAEETEAPVEEKATEEVAEEAEAPVEEKATEEVVEEAEAPKAEKKAAIGGPKSKKKKTASTFEDEVVEEEEVLEPKEEAKTSKAEVEAKIRKQIEKKQEKEANLGVYRILEYLKEEHQWENWLFLVISIITLVLGCLMLNGALNVRSDFPLIGEYPTVFAWILVVLASVGLIYALYPFLKPAFPELKKITWLTGPKFLGNAIRTFVFIIIFTLLFLLYDVFIQQLLALIM